MPMMSVCNGNGFLWTFCSAWNDCTVYIFHGLKKELGAHVLINFGFSLIQQLLKGFVWQHLLDWPILRTVGKPKKLSDDLRRWIVSLHKLGRCLGAISKKTLQISRSSVQTAVCKLFGCVNTLPNSRRRPKMLSSDEKNLVRMFMTNPKTT